MLSSAELAYIRDGIAQDLRNDGRSRNDYRNFFIKTGVVSQASGSACIKIGSTYIIACIKAELGSPPEGNPHHGRLDINIECSSTAAPLYAGRGGDELSSELRHVLERSFMGSANGSGAAIDLSSLCISAGKTCWVLYMDALIISMGGNVLDALSIAFKAALSDTRLPKVEVIAGEDGDEEGIIEVSDDLSEASRLDLANMPVLVTLTKVGEHYIVDATSEEEMHMNGAVSMAVSRKGMIHGVSKRGSDGLDSSVLFDMFLLAKKIGKNLIVVSDDEIAAALRESAES